MSVVYVYFLTFLNVVCLIKWSNSTDALISLLENNYFLQRYTLRRKGSIWNLKRF